MQIAEFDVNISGGTIVPGVPNWRIRVLAYVLSFSGQVNAKWTDQVGHDLTGWLYGAAGVTIVAPFASNDAGSRPGWFVVADPGDTLELKLSAAVAVGGHIIYDLVP